MSNWSEGYVNSINYTYGYYGELNPNSLVIPFLMAGLATPKMATACELGFGQGISINAHAAASNRQWWGTDFNPSHVSFAQELASQTDSNVHLFDEAFQEFCSRDDLPNFDFIGLHGIWSWVSLDNRNVLVDFIRRKLNVGGVLYISYNTLPGWAAAAPLRHVLAEHAHTFGAASISMAEQVGNAVQFTEQLVQLSHLYRQQVPSLSQRIEQIGKQNPHYLAHEYFNRDWHPMYFAEMNDCLESAKISYACSANYLNDLAPCLFDEQQQAFLSEIGDPNFAQTVKDYLLNTQFRRDYWVKGARTLNPLQVEQTWQQLRFMLVKPAEEVEMTVSATRTVNLLSEVYQPLLEQLSNYRVCSGAELQAALTPKPLASAQLFQAIAILHARQDLVLVQDEETIAQARPRCRAANRHLMQNSRASSDVNYLFSPVTGGAVAHDRIAQLFLLAYSEGKKEPSQWADYVWQVLKAQGQCLIYDGKTLESEAENQARLQVLADDFAKTQLPAALALEIISKL